MLRSVRIESFLLIRDTEIEFGKGLNVISGETGTGKSMTLSALEFVMGKQGSYPEGTAVEVVLESEGEETVLRREIRGGRSRYFLNGRGTTAKVVKEILEERVSLQGQNEFVKLLREDYQRDLLDRFGGLEDLREKVGEIYREFSSKRKKLEELLSKREEVLRKRDYLEYRLREIEEVGLSAEEVEELKERAKTLTQIEKRAKYLMGALSELYEGEDSAYSKISSAIRSLSRIGEVSESIKGPLEKLSRIRDHLLEVAEELRSKIEEVSPEEIDRVNELLYRVQRLERKYKKPYGEILKEAETLREEISKAEELERAVEDLNFEIERLKNELKEASEELSSKRKESARRLERSVKKVLEDLNLERAVLKVDLKEVEPTRYGSDRVTFLFSAHGSDPKPLGEVASGGELTRLFLSLSLILPPVETYIFDEVDAGISGETSLKLAKMLRKLSKNMQIIAITHSAPVCAAGDVNFLTEKKFIGDIPYIEVRRISGEEKVREVARLMGTTTETTIKGARELIEMVRT